MSPLFCILAIVVVAVIAVAVIPGPSTNQPEKNKMLTEFQENILSVVLAAAIGICLAALLVAWWSS
jgi:hypothetical protein